MLRSLCCGTVHDTLEIYICSDKIAIVHVRQEQSTTILILDSERVFLLQLKITEHTLSHSHPVRNKYKIAKTILSKSLHLFGMMSHLLLCSFISLVVNRHC